MKLSDYITSIENKSRFPLDDIIGIAKRKNNPKRDFLFVNKLMGKHIEVAAVKSLQLFEDLYKEVAKALYGKKVLIIGFAETATAIAQYIMHQSILRNDFNAVYYAQTTRENIIAPRDVKCISFEEEHSHATTQKLYIHNDLPEYDVILFVEDEITTGNTILNTIEKLGQTKNYAVASFLNLQNQENINRFEQKKIERIALIFGKMKQDLPIITLDDSETTNQFDNKKTPVKRYIHPSDIRIGKTPKEFITYIDLSVKRVLNDDKIKNLPTNHNIPFIGTEEFMYVPMLCASLCDTTFRATTRSPICIDHKVITSRTALNSFYDSERLTYLYNVTSDEMITITDVPTDKPNTISVIPYLHNLVNHSYSDNEVSVLLQDVNGKVPVLNTLEREKRNQKGVHYSEMLPIEYNPSPEYLTIYEESLKELSQDTANAIIRLAEKLLKHKGENMVLVSLARAGTPIGVILKDYYRFAYGLNVPHYTISIIRGKGIDKTALFHICNTHSAKHVQFIDGWVGKGAINHVLETAINELIEPLYEGLSPELAVVTDPASVTELYGTRQDFLIPSACLNSIVSGLFSRTVKTKDMTDNELHGAVYYKDNEKYDLSHKFINTIMDAIKKKATHDDTHDECISDDSIKGIDEVNTIAKQFNIQDINKIKPGVGETTRVLLRRVPDKVLINKNAPKKYLKHIYQLAKEKNIKIEEYPFKKYNVCGIIKNVADL